MTKLVSSTCVSFSNSFKMFDHALFNSFHNDFIPFFGVSIFTFCNKKKTEIFFIIILP